MDKGRNDAYFQLRGRRRYLPNIELGPNDYRKQDPRTGRWHLPDDPKLARNYLFVLIAVLAFVFWHRGELETWTLFGVTALFAFCAGGFFAMWLKDVY
jgi:hypothetical protein